MKCYDYIIVDVFNYIYRKKSTEPAKSLLKSVINGIEDDIRSRITKNGALYLLFDPIPKSDLGLSKTFTYNGFRKEILSSYKSDRIHDPQVVKIAEVVQKYFDYIGDSVKILSSDKYEADDYVEPLIKKLTDSSLENFTSGPIEIALLSNDQDWARYISDTSNYNIVLINDNWSKPYTIRAFKTTFQFYPSPCANTLYKAIFGDSSDCITGAIFIKKAKFSVPIKEMALRIIQQASSEHWTIDHLVKRWESTQYLKVVSKSEKDAFDEFYLAMTAVDQKAPVIDAFVRNIKVIRSALEGADISEFITCHELNETKHRIIHDSVFGIDFLHSFGKV